MEQQPQTKQGASLELMKLDFDVVDRVVISGNKYCLFAQVFYKSSDQVDGHVFPRNIPAVYAQQNNIN